LKKFKIHWAFYGIEHRKKTVHDQVPVTAAQMAEGANKSRVGAEIPNTEDESLMDVLDGRGVLGVITIKIWTFCVGLRRGSAAPQWFRVVTLKWRNLN